MPILEVLRAEFASASKVLEIGSGTGQHAVFFAPALPWLRWQPSELAENLPGLRMWLDAASSPNLSDGIELDVRAFPRADQSFDAVFSANTAHIMHWPQVEQLFAGLDRQLGATAAIALYGPFRFDGNYTAASNAAFDRWLGANDPGQGIRDAERLDELAAAGNFKRRATHQMPANNNLLVWRREPSQ